MAVEFYKSLNLFTSDIFLCQFRDAWIRMGLSGQRTAVVGCLVGACHAWPHQCRILDQTRLQITHVSGQRGNSLMAAIFKKPRDHLVSFQRHHNGSQSDQK